MGFINAAVNELMCQRMDWPQAQSLDVVDFTDHVIEEIRWLLGVGEDDGRRVAGGLWRGLRNRVDTAPPG